MYLNKLLVNCKFSKSSFKLITLKKNKMKSQIHIYLTKNIYHMYKNIFSILLLAGFTIANGQVIIGDAAGGTALDKSSVLLEFANTSNRGIIVPYVTTAVLPTTFEGGTIVLHAPQPSTTTARMKYYNAVTSNWVDLSGQDGVVTAALSNQPSGVTETGKSIIGASSSSADGVLVLESSSKAMVLPIVDNTNQIINPSPGMMVYLNKTGAKRLAVFNGTKWSYWKP